RIVPDGTLVNWKYPDSTVVLRFVPSMVTVRPVAAAPGAAAAPPVMCTVPAMVVPPLSDGAVGPPPQAVTANDRQAAISSRFLAISMISSPKAHECREPWTRS